MKHNAVKSRQLRFLILQECIKKRKLCFLLYLVITTPDRHLIHTMNNVFDPDMIDTNFVEACMNGINLDEMKGFIENGARINYAHTISHMTPLTAILAKSRIIGVTNSIPLLDYLFESGADPNFIPDVSEAYECIPLTLALYNSQLTKYMLEHGADPCIAVVALKLDFSCVEDYMHAWHSELRDMFWARYRELPFHEMQHLEQRLINEAARDDIWCAA